ncbi:MAG: TetR/AcrR family transcriptional regulator [Thermodesulfovibrionales bacterium]
MRQKGAHRRSSDESRRRILAAASVVFAERGYERTSVREVARRAGISVGGIYLYFRNKEDLYTGLMRSQMDEFLGRVGELRSKPPLGALRGLIDLYLEIAVTKTRMLSTSVKEYDLEFKRPVREAFFASQQKIVAEILHQGIGSGVFRKIDCGAVALVILVTLRGAILGYLTGDVRNTKQYADHLYELFLKGIRSNRHAS